MTQRSWMSRFGSESSCFDIMVRRHAPAIATRIRSNESKSKSTILVQNNDTVNLLSWCDVMIETTLRAIGESTRNPYSGTKNESDELVLHRTEERISKEATYKFEPIWRTKFSVQQVSPTIRRTFWWTYVTRCITFDVDFDVDFPSSWQHTVSSSTTASPSQYHTGVCGPDGAVCGVSYAWISL